MVGTKSKKSSSSTHAAVLNMVPIFAACTSKELAAIAAAGKEVAFEAGKVICKEGETGIGMHVILEGETKVQIGGRTRRRFGPGAFFGEVALLDGGPRSATVIAETPVVTLSIPVWNFKSLLKSNPNLSLKVLEEVCRRLRISDAAITH